VKKKRGGSFTDRPPEKFGQNDLVRKQETKGVRQQKMKRGVHPPSSATSMKARISETEKKRGPLIGKNAEERTTSEKKGCRKGCS